MALTDNIVSYWKLDEASGTATDSAGTNTLTDNNTVTRGAAVIGNGALFDFASAENFSITDASQTGLDFAGDFSFNFWFNLPSTGPANTVFTLITKFAAAPDREYALYLVHTATPNWNIDFDASQNGTTNIADPSLIGVADATFAATTWYMMTLTYNTSSGVATYYKNGTSLGTGGSTAGALANKAATFLLGPNSQWAAATLTAYMDEVGIWSRLLTATEITQLYNGGAGLQYPFTVAATGSSLPFLHAG